MQFFRIFQILVLWCKFGANLITFGPAVQIFQLSCIINKGGPIRALWGDFFSKRTVMPGRRDLLELKSTKKPERNEFPMWACPMCRTIRFFNLAWKQFLYNSPFLLLYHLLGNYCCFCSIHKHFNATDVAHYYSGKHETHLRSSAILPILSSSHKLDR